MKRTTPLLLAAALAAATGAATAQDFVFGWNPRSGDVWVDTTLADVNRYGDRHRDAFVDELVRYYRAPRDYVTDLLVTQRWAPGDVYYACAIAAIIGRSCRYVAEEWNRDHGQGWGAVAQRLGIKPGSPEFHRLKRGFVATYDRWARPIELDDRLRADFPDRGRGNAHGNPGHGNHGKAKGNQGSQGKAKGNQGNQGKGKGNQGKGQGRGKD